MKKESHTKHTGFIGALKEIHPIYYIVSVLFVLTAVGFGYGYKVTTETFDDIANRAEKQQEQLDLLAASLASTTSILAQNITDTESSLAQALEQEKRNLESKLGTVQSQVGVVSGTVDTLEKLSQTDPELLEKYSKVFFLNENYVPKRLADIQNKHKYIEERDVEILVDIKPFLENMLDEALASSIPIYVMSAYRSFDYQGDLKSSYSVTYGEGANQFSADQGYSEHQLGTTVDLITTGIGGTLSGFGNTPAFLWLVNNAHKYGFTLSYPENNTYYVYEPWHWRFVGVNLATHLHNTGRHFYDLEQREIDDYLVSVFDTKQ